MKNVQQELTLTQNLVNARYTDYPIKVYDFENLFRQFLENSTW